MYYNRVVFTFDIFYTILPNNIGRLVGITTGKIIFSRHIYNAGYSQSFFHAAKILQLKRAVFESPRENSISKYYSYNFSFSISFRPEYHRHFLTALFPIYVRTLKLTRPTGGAEPGRAGSRKIRKSRYMFSIASTRLTCILVQPRRHIIMNQLSYN